MAGSLADLERIVTEAATVVAQNQSLAERVSALTWRAEDAATFDARPDFRNFGHPGAASAPNIYRGPGSAWDAQIMLAKLMRRMAPYRLGDGVTSANDENFNPRTPAGYTYLGQFAAHDIIRNSSLLTDVGSQESGRAI
jgi:hypothetical protein